MLNCGCFIRIARVLRYLIVKAMFILVCIYILYYIISLQENIFHTKKEKKNTDHLFVL